MWRSDGNSPHFSALRKSPAKAETAAVPIKLLTYYYRKVQRGIMLPLEPRLCIHLGGISSIYWSPSVPGPPLQRRAPVTMFIYGRRSRLANLALFPKPAVWRDFAKRWKGNLLRPGCAMFCNCARKFRLKYAFHIRPRAGGKKHIWFPSQCPIFKPVVFCFLEPYVNELSVNIHVFQPTFYNTHVSG